MRLVSPLRALIWLIWLLPSRSLVRPRSKSLSDGRFQVSGFRFQAVGNAQSGS